jgi:PIN domain nuclease of toxin-antitoxin system
LAYSGPRQPPNLPKVKLDLTTDELLADSLVELSPSSETSFHRLPPMGGRLSADEGSPRHPRSGCGLCSILGVCGEVSGLLGASDTEKFLSPISVWETLILAERGRLALEPDPESWVRTQLRRGPVRQIPLDQEIAIQSRNLLITHQDPTDRFIAATARVHELLLVTADERLLHQPDGYTALRAQ